MEITNVQSFDSLMNSDSSNLYCIKIGATWCGPCRRIVPFIEALATKYNEVVFLTLEIDKCKDFDVEDYENDFTIKVVPTFIFLKEGRIVEVHEGSDKEELEKKIKLVLYREIV